MWKKYWTVTSIDEALDVLSQEKDKARIVAGGTDLVLELKHDAHPGLETLIDVSRIRFEQDPIYQDEGGNIHIHLNATHNHCVASSLLQENAFLLPQASYSIGTPQIRNMGTIFGNVVTASPANDTITPLVALKAKLEIRSKKGKRIVPINDFYKGVRKIDLQADEMVTDIFFEPLKKNQRSIFLKFILRKIHAISVVNVAIILTLENEVISDAVVTLGAVAPTIIHAEKCEEFLKGKSLDEETIKKAAQFAAEDATPITDIRSSDKYRSRLVAILTQNGLNALKNGEEKGDFPENPVLLWGKKEYTPSTIPQKICHTIDTPITTNLNDETRTLNTLQTKTLLKLVREGAQLTGSKLGCGEGECGACTMILDGIPVLGCLVPAPRAHGANVITIEGITPSEGLHPIQQAYVDEGAVQCGFCTPGFIMSTLKLLEEFPHPEKEEIEAGLAGNICRCTGYYSIINAVEKASRMMSE